jgi:hypothetical protein
MYVGDGLTLVATVMNDPANAGVSWAMSAPGFDCSKVDCGSFAPQHAASGASVLYAAPSGAAAFASQVNLTATSVTDHTVSAMAAISITVPQIAVYIEPTGALMPVNAKQHFKAFVEYDKSNAGVIWSVGGCSGGATVCGSVTNPQSIDVGQYTVDYLSPAKVPLSAQVTITATSVTDPTKSSSANVQISAINFLSHKYGAGSAPTDVALVDLDGDGNLDVAVTDYGNPSAADDGGISILLGNGDGTFRVATSVPAGKNPIHIAAADFDNDGKQDLVISLLGDRPQNGSGSVEILFGNGDGTFTRTASFSAGTAPFTVTVGDFNRDGKMDFAVTDVNTGVYVFLGNSDGSFQKSGPITAGKSPDAVAMGDVNGDGIMDLAVADLHDPASIDYGGISILLGKGDGTFENPEYYRAALFPTSLAVGDVNGDGKPDIVASSFEAAFGLEGSVLDVFLGNGDGTFAADKSVRTGSGKYQSVFPLSVAIADFDSDGRPDVAEVLGPGVAIMRGNGNGTFQVLSLSGPDQRQTLLFQPDKAPYKLAVGDLNGDGKPDIVVANQGSNSISVMINATNP